MAAPRKYPDELRERAIRLTLDAREDPASRSGACSRIGGQLGTIDLDVGAEVPTTPDIAVRRLFVDHLVALVAADSTMGRAPQLTIDHLCDYPHISASRRGLSRGPLDDALEELGRPRTVIAVVPTYAAAALQALEPDVIALVPRVLAHQLASRGVPIRAHEVPLTLPEVRVDQRWHRRLDGDRPSQWLRDHVLAAVGDLTGS
ncbi:LysR substrate-binding domain-containing protein [Dermatophilaceae bacterium Soc4.6]